MFNLIWFAIVISWHYLFLITCRGKTPSNSKVSKRNIYWQIWTDGSYGWVDSSTNSWRAWRIHWVFIVAGLSASRVVQVTRGEEARWGSEDADAALTAGGQRKALLSLLLPILYRQGALPLHEGENVELWCEVNRLLPRQRPAAARNCHKRKCDLADTRGMR